MENSPSSGSKSNSANNNNNNNTAETNGRDDGGGATTTSAATVTNTEKIPIGCAHEYEARAPALGSQDGSDNGMDRQAENSLQSYSEGGSRAMSTISPMGLLAAATSAAAVFATPPPPASITVNISTTTGGNFSIVVDPQNTVEHLKKVVSKKLRVSKDRICLLHRERELQEGTIRENGLCEGAKIILIPNVETGLLAQRPESTVMQALESLNDSQVNDFLSGKSPLNLNMRLGDHMMIIQLQLSTVNPPSTSTASASGSSDPLISSAPANQLTESQQYQVASSNSSPSVSSGGCSLDPESAMASSSNIRHGSDNGRNSGRSSRYHHHHYHHIKKLDNEDKHNRLHAHRGIHDAADCKEESCVTAQSSADQRSVNGSHMDGLLAAVVTDDQELNIEANTNDNELVDEILKYGTDDQDPVEDNNNITLMGEECESTVNDEPMGIEENLVSVIDGNDQQSPIKSLSNLVSGPIINLPNQRNSSLTSDPIAAKLTSCLCKRLETPVVETNAICDPPIVQNRRYLDADCSAGGSKSAMDLTTSHSGAVSSDLRNVGTSGRHQWLHKTANNPILKPKGTNKIGTVPGCASNLLRRAISNPLDGVSNSAGPSTAATETKTPENSSNGVVPATQAGVPTVIDTRALAEASRNLTQTLKKLSKEVFTNKVDISESNSKKIGTGAVIESMKHHGKGIYSGTFSGTLNPALQDRYGRPKRDISTIIHILNDLLSATPQYRRGASISLDTNSTTGHYHHVGKSSTSSNSRQTMSSRRHHHHHHHSHHHHHHHHHHQQHHPHNNNQSNDQCSKCVTGLTRATPQMTNGDCVGHSYPSPESACKPFYAGNNASVPVIGGANSIGGMRPCICKTPKFNAFPPATHQQTFMDPASHSPSTDGRQSLSSSSSALIDLASKSGGTDVDNPCGKVEEAPNASDLYSMRNLPTCCNKCSSMAIENNKTKFKLDQLKLVMQQKKERREARKLKNMPYSNVPMGGGGVSEANVVADAKAPTLVTTIGQVETPSLPSSEQVTPMQVDKVQMANESMENGGSSSSGATSANSSIAAADDRQGAPASDVSTSNTNIGQDSKAAEKLNSDDSHVGERQEQQQNHHVEEVDTAA